jgi:hypothetical protein
MRFLFLSSIVILLGITFSIAELPPDLPGQEITDQYLRRTILVDTTHQVENFEKPSPTWFDNAAKTWEAPVIAEQISSDKSFIPMGKGGIFIPRMSELHKEPDVVVYDKNKKIIANGEPGKTYTVEPGEYVVKLGSGAERQRLSRLVTVEESRMSPVLPDWSCLIIETVDSNSNFIRGEYELVRIDEFEPLGIGYGADVSKGEAVKAWILKPGTYKILGRGEGYNTMRNFVTVRLLPGELTRFTLIQAAPDFTILGGGTIDITSGSKLTSNWKYGGNIGGSILFGDETDRNNTIQNKRATFISLYTRLWLRYLDNPFEWESMLSVNEGVNVSHQDGNSISSGVPDDFKFRSLFVWRYLSWLGPYASVDVNTNLLPYYLNLGDKNNFAIVNNNLLDSTKFFDDNTFKVKPSLCPVITDVGGGVSLDALSKNFLEIILRLGFIGSFRNFPEKFAAVSIDDLEKDSTIKNAFAKDSLLRLRYEQSLIIQKENKASFAEFGPQASLNLNLRLGRIGTASAELKIFDPPNRFRQPDFDLNTLLSWRLSRSVTLDYVYEYNLKQPEQQSAKIDKRTHAVILRFSFSSR